MNQKGTLHHTFEYDGYGNDPGFIEVRIHYDFTPGSPETGRYSGPPENYDPGSAHEVDYDYAEREIMVDGKKVWNRLKTGEWLDEWCQSWLGSRDKADLIEGLPNGGERDPDDERDARRDREMEDRT